MDTTQLDMWLLKFNEFDDFEKFYSMKILEELYIEDELYTEKIYMIFNNKKKNSIKKILDNLVNANLVEMSLKDNDQRKYYSLTKHGENLINTHYSNYPYIVK